MEDNTNSPNKNSRVLVEVLDEIDRERETIPPKSWGNWDNWGNWGNWADWWN